MPYLHRPILHTGRPSASAAAPGDRLCFRLTDPGGRWRSVTLDCERAIPTPTRELTHHDGGWEMVIPAPPLTRLEYTFSVVPDQGGPASSIPDPANPLRVETAFGPKSVLELSGYAPPRWVSRTPVPGRFTAMVVDGETEDALPITVWSPADSEAAEPMPLLLVHDGPEYDLLAGLTRYCGVQIADGVLPRHRVALAQPVRRNAWYSGSPRYLRTELGAGLGRLQSTYAVSGPVAVMGASLGGLTALLAGLAGAPAVGAVFSQSGTFFQVTHDDHESGFPFFHRIEQQVQAVLHARHTDHPLRIGMTCGELEENAANNRAMAAALRRAGHFVEQALLPDLHNYTAWRDSLDPFLTNTLRECWGEQG